MSSAAPSIERFGAGSEAVLFVHGWGQSAASLAPLAEVVADKSGVSSLVVNLPGFGQTTAPSEAWGIKEYQRWLKEFLANEGITSATVVGHSVGGKIAVSLAAENPGLVNKLVLIGASGLTRDRTRMQRYKISAIGALRSVIKKIDALFRLSIFKNWFVPRFASRDYLQAGEMLQTFIKIVNQDVTSEAMKLSVPTLLIWGGADEESHISVAKKFNSLIKNSQLVVLPQRDHFPFVGAGSHLIAYYINRFLRAEGSND